MAERLEKHQADYYAKSYEEYSFQELGNIVGFFAKRASHRTDEIKKSKDLYDAKNYLTMMQMKLEKVCSGLDVDYKDL